MTRKTKRKIKHEAFFRYKKTPQREYIHTAATLSMVLKVQTVPRLSTGKRSLCECDSILTAYKPLCFVALQSLSLFMNPLGSGLHCGRNERQGQGTVRFTGPAVLLKIQNEFYQCSNVHLLLCYLYNMC